MMISTKGKHNFWSQLLLSMIAIFALPVSQNIETQQSNLTSENVQSIHHIQQLIQSAIAEKKAQQPISFTPQQSTQEKPAAFQPHFVVAIFPFHAPIRAGPPFLS